MLSLYWRSTMWCNTVRDGGNVQRYHTKNLIKLQDVAQHSFNCALIVDHFGELIDLNEQERYEVLLYMLLHDIPEQAIGDTPYCIKTKSQGISDELDKEEEQWCIDNMPSRYYYIMYADKLSEKQRVLCKFVDSYEALMKVNEEIRMGNNTVRSLSFNIHTVCSKMVEE